MSETFEIMKSNNGPSFKERAKGVGALLKALTTTGLGGRIVADLVMGRERRDGEERISRLAIHEAGHALVGTLQHKSIDRVALHRLSFDVQREVCDLLGTSGSAGHVSGDLSSSYKDIMTFSQKARIGIIDCLAGYAAENAYFDDQESALTTNLGTSDILGAIEIAQLLCQHDNLAGEIDASLSTHQQELLRPIGIVFNTYTQLVALFKENDFQFALDLIATQLRKKKRWVSRLGVDFRIKQLFDQNEVTWSELQTQLENQVTIDGLQTT